ncbi:30S ribosomal protein S1 [Paenibacillus sp. J31TS4]|uniref:30S ribosomal protein S1 n=1 Tax=Paenibacillus sp. J31TS4 TaxID=2807195 RepID=UPI001B0480DD|nr:30S ribosomal protein S1 [Paenibacillus sp. J31TS4]GIP37492.1 30S ribosomal protein S1 [Paenibacillus sp. J31TS4]
MSEESKMQETTPETEINAAGAESAEQADYANVTALKKGDTVKGKIVKVDNDQAFVDVSYKYDGIIPLRELSSVAINNASDIVEVGQEIELKVVTIDDEKEKLVLSKRAIDSENAWDDLQSKMDNNETIEAKVADVVKGGLVVDVGLRGFIPASMVERHFVEDFSDYKGRTLRLKVKELDREKNKVILSQKDVLDEDYEANKKDIMNKLEIGQVIEGTVQRLTPFGAFVDIGGIDGLVHISEMAWHHVEQASEVVKEGDQVKVKVLKLDPENERISLSIKAAQPGPWEQLGDKFEIGAIVPGTVKRLVSFGAFVEIAPGVEGLVHISQIAHRHIGTPHEVLEEGQEVNVKILDLNPAEKRVSLSIKETEDAPAAPARPERTSRREKDNNHGDYVAQPNQKLSQTLGELFGDKLSKFK